MRRLVKALDARFDAALEPLRSVAAVRWVFSAASTAGDFSVIWHLSGIVLASTEMIGWDEALFSSAALGAESLVVNQGVKRVFGRVRPTRSGDPRFGVRTPSTSSFPSGHASSATLAVMVLGSFAGPGAVAPLVIAGAVVALSRVVVRIHHASDVIAGVVTGAVLGAVALVAAGAVR